MSPFKKALLVLSILSSSAWTLKPHAAFAQQRIPVWLERTPRIDVSERFVRIEQYNRYLASANAAHAKAAAARRSRLLYGVGALAGVGAGVYAMQRSAEDPAAENGTMAVAGLALVGASAVLGGLNFLFNHMDTKSWTKMEEDNLRRARAIYPERDPQRGLPQRR